MTVVIQEEKDNLEMQDQVNVAKLRLKEFRFRIFLG